MSEQEQKKRERLKLAWRRVMGRKDDKSPDQQIVYDHLCRQRDDDLDDTAGAHRTTAIILNVGGCEALKKIIKLSDQSGPLDGKKEPKIITK